MLRKVAALFVVALAFGPGQSSGADADEPRPCRVGLALSGGGARGAAHVGVLKVLEELRVPVDCLAGTSMGAIVGGLYTSGMTAAEIERVLDTADWRELLGDRPDRRQIGYRRKQDDLRFLASFELGFNHGRFQLPRGLISGQDFGFLLRELTLPVADRDDFDDLPIPYRAVAADIRTGEMAVLSGGDLARAMRASMAVPGVFTPVELDGRLLVDGGVVRNLPVDVVRALGAEIVIAVDVSTDPVPDLETLDSAVAIVDRMKTVLIQQNVDAQRTASDLLITPDLTQESALDFLNAARMVGIGEVAAREQTDRLRDLAVDETSWRAWRERARRPPTPTGRIASVEIAAGSRTDPHILLRQVATRPGDPLDVAAIRRDVERLYLLGFYEQVGFRLVPAEDGWNLLIEAHDKPWGPHYFRFGVGVSTDFEGRSAFRLTTNYTLPNLNPRRGEVKVNLDIGEEPEAFAELYQPLDWGGRWFVAPSLTLGRFRRPAYVREQFFGELEADTAELGLDFGRSFGRWGEARVGILAGIADASLDLGLVGRLDETFNRVALRAGLVLDQLDRPTFPQHGFLASVSLIDERSALGGELDGRQLTVDALGVTSFGRTSVLARVLLGSGLGSEGTLLESLELGGLFRLSGLPDDSVAGAYGGLGVVNVYHRLSDAALGLDTALFVGASLEVGNTWIDQQQVDTGDLVFAGSVYLGIRLGIGPVYLGYGRAEGSNGVLYLLVGRSF